MVRGPKELPLSQARAELRDIIEDVRSTGVRYTLTYHGRPYVAVVSIDDLRRLEKLDARKSRTK